MGINMAENDATEYEIMAFLGHTSPKATRIYTEEANRRKLARAATEKATLSQRFSTAPPIKVVPLPSRTLLLTYMSNAANITPALVQDNHTGTTNPNQTPSQFLTHSGIDHPTPRFRVLVTDAGTKPHSPET